MTNVVAVASRTGWYVVVKQIVIHGSFHASVMWAVASFGRLLLRVKYHRTIRTIKIFAVRTIEHVTSSVAVVFSRLRFSGG